MSRGLTLEQMEFLNSKGLSGEDMIAFAKMGAAKSKGAERQARYRARKNGTSVTSDVTRDASLPPIDNTHTPLASNEAVKRPSAEIAKPDDVSEPVWSDWQKHRKAKKAKITQTAMTGIRREAEKAGWTVEAALSKAMERGWTGFEAQWVQADHSPAKPSRDPPSHLAYLTAQRRQREEFERRNGTTG